MEIEEINIKQSIPSAFPLTSVILQQTSLKEKAFEVANTTGSVPNKYRNKNPIIRKGTIRMQQHIIFSLRKLGFESQTFLI